MQRGYVKVWRKMLESCVFQHPGLLHLWIWCLLEATHKECHIPVKTGRGLTVVKLQPGQLIFGRFAAAKKLRCKPATIADRLQKLKSLQKIDTQPGTHFTIVSIVNWEHYQSEEKKSGTQPGTQVAPNQHPSSTNKNVKNKESVCTPQKRSALEPVCFEISNRLLDLIRSRDPGHKQPNIQAWASHVDKLIRLDGRTPATISAVLEFSQADPFWQTNILSTSSLREKFPKLIQKMQSNGNRPGNVPGPALPPPKPFDFSELERDD